MMKCPTMHQSYANVYNGLLPHHGYLKDNDKEVVKKKPIKYVMGAATIGTGRVSASNYEKRSICEVGEYPIYYSSLALHEMYMDMSPTELRIEDYFLIRTAPTNSDLYKSIPNITSTVLTPAFNRQLFSPYLQQPNLNNAIVYSQLPPRPNMQSPNQPINQFGVYQTPLERLSMLDRPTIKPEDFQSSLKTLQKNSFNRNINPNAFEQMNDVLNLSKGGFIPQENTQISSNPQISYFKFNNSANALDIFLQFFYKDLKNCYEKRENIYPMIEGYLVKCFMINEQVDQMKKMYFSQLKISPHASSEQSAKICKKYGECIEMRKLLDGLTKELQGKLTRNEMSNELLQYSQDILKILYDIYSNLIKEVYRYCHHQIPQESLKKISDALEHKESILLSQYHNIPERSNLYNHEEILNTPYEAPTFIPDNLLTYNMNEVNTSPQTPLHFNKSYIDYDAFEREQLQNQIFFINSLNSHLKCLYEKEKLEREEHLFDIVNKYEDVGCIDDFLNYRKKKKEASEYFILIEDAPRKSSERQERSERQEISTQSLSYSRSSQSQASLSRSQLSASFTKVNRISSTIYFEIRIIWNEENEIFRIISGSFKISSKQLQLIQLYLNQFIKTEFGSIIRDDANFTFSELKKQQKTRSTYEIYVQVHQSKININPPYEVKPIFSQKDQKGVQIKELTIWNEFGSVKWSQQIDISTLDFIANSFEIGNNTVQCQCDCLNVPCLITFFNFPKYLIKLEGTFYHEVVESKLRKHIQKFRNCELISIDWIKKQYTISSQEFYFQGIEDLHMERDGMLEEEALLNEMREKLDIYSFDWKEDLVN